MNPARMACASMRCLSWRWRWPALRGRLLAIALANAAGGVLFAIIVAQAADMNRYGLSVVAAASSGSCCWRWRSFVWLGRRGARRSSRRSGHYLGASVTLECKLFYPPKY